MASVELPLDILMRIFGFLPVPSVCRLRAVCKQWNALIDSPEFGTLCALAPRQRFYVLLTPGKCRNSDAGWCVLDLADERFYNLDSTYLVDQANPTRNPNYWLDTVDAAGGLFLVLYRSSDLKALYVCHPVTKSLKLLPPIVDLDLVLPTLAVDYSAKAYKVVLFGECMHMYDSEREKWTMLASPPGNTSPVSSAVCNNRIYTVFGKNGSCYILLTYSLLDDEWSSKGIELPPSLSFVQLVVASGEVYIVAGTRIQCYCGQETCMKSGITISRVLPSPKLPVRVAGMPETWHSLLYPKCSAWNNCEGMPSFLAVASEGAIVFTSSSGRSVVYDLSRGLWRSVQKRHHFTRTLSASSTTLNPGFLL